MSQPEANQITVFSDYVCPFCYIGRHSLSQYQETRDEELDIDWHPFDLRSQKRNADGEINHEVDDGKDDEYYSQAKENVRRLQEKYGIEMTLDLATDIDSLPAQIASFYVKQEYPAKWLDFDEAIFTALWQDGRDIGDCEVLLDLAEEADIDPEEIGLALDDETLREQLFAKFNEAHEYGVTGVPTFAYDGYAARGAVPPEQLERLVDGV